MGKASARKKNRKLLNNKVVVNSSVPTTKVVGVNSSAQTTKVFEIDVLEKLYRFFETEEYAEQFLKGEIYITTLEKCQNLKNPSQGDVGEGTMSYSMTSAGFDSNDPEHLARARLAGIRMSPGVQGMEFSSTRSQSSKNCYILCMTKEFSPEVFADDFGRQCVEISNPALFFELVSAALDREKTFKTGGAASILYVDRDYKQDKVPVQYPIGLVKPPDLYASQKEFRFFWTVDKPEGIQPFLLRVPEAANLMKRVWISNPENPSPPNEVGGAA
ncbi:hypothetical protein BOW65_09540 [Pseudomonas koreensis]|uniref:hypothetical protein n=1 Tax=Pseudomonas koreensis TaxID=198620 RepID=UPI000986662C|nr:hypothetical protein [Pseudomonas koreensis]OOH81314.1 hypothetical protein BOW65_09540 [Pseudomonas koreensis]